MNFNYFNFKPFGDKVLLTNDLGRFMFLDQDEFEKLMTKKVPEDSSLCQDLEEKGFIYTGSKLSFIEKFYLPYQEAKNYAFQPTSLHIFVLTTYCNMNCIYCQASSPESIRHYTMDKETARKAVDLALSSRNPYLTFEFQGGEPLLNFDTLKFIVEYAEENKSGKQINYSVVTNLTCLTEEMADYFANKGISVSTSLDGDAVLHNANRPFPDGSGTYDKVAAKLEILQKRGISAGAIQTTTAASLSRPAEIVQTYVDLGFTSLFLRPLTPLGCAANAWDKIGYTPNEYIDFYRRCMEEILKQNQNGKYISEGTASILFSKVLHQNPVNYMELRSPCGAGTGQLCYFPTGDVFTCDEGRMAYEMGSDAFRLGNVFESSMEDILQSSNCRTVCKTSVLESIPECCDCVYQPYCGICPVINLELYNDMLPKSAGSWRCSIFKGIQDELFQILKEADPKTLELLEKWST